MNQNEKRQIGNMGEKVAVRYLKRHFYRILETQYSRPYGEIDIIAEKKNTLVFVEVKTRAENSWFSPAYAVNKSKQQRIIKTALSFVQQHKSKKQIRFDIIEVITDPNTGKKLKINHIENAFTCGDGYAVY